MYNVTIYVLSIRVAINHEPVFRFLPTPGVFLSTEKGSRAVSRSTRESQARERERRWSAGASYWFSWIYPCFQKLLSPAHTGVSPVANRSSTADKVLARHPLWSPAGGYKDSASPVSAPGNANDWNDFSTDVPSSWRTYTCVKRSRIGIYAREEIRAFCVNRWYIQWDGRVACQDEDVFTYILGHTYIYYMYIFY